MANLVGQKQNATHDDGCARSLLMMHAKREVASPHVAK